MKREALWSKLSVEMSVDMFLHLTINWSLLIFHFTLMQMSFAKALTVALTINTVTHQLVIAILLRCELFVLCSHQY